MKRYEFGLCRCGCGQPTSIYKNTVRAIGRIKGQPARYIRGHNRRGKVVDWAAVKNFDAAFTIDESTGCWNWLKVKDSQGYGQISVSGKTKLAHRYSYERVHGIIPDGLYIDHLCRNKSCVNPVHLEPVTPAQNIQRGNSAKLTSEQASEIRSWWSMGKYSRSEIGTAYGVHRRTIHDVLSGRSWAMKDGITIPGIEIYSEKC